MASGKIRGLISCIQRHDAEAGYNQWPNLLLLSCHSLNEAAQLIQGFRFYKFHYGSSCFNKSVSESGEDNANDTDVDNAENFDDHRTLEYILKNGHRCFNFKFHNCNSLLYYTVDVA
ncbi:Mitochondrial pyruvate carrier [Trichinella spiralis]|uniref:Mitochondrial pyruvate carrier n=1 Tax=Trichinella spiralis TaxID=6334 RepID=A0ABR3K940_TRISP